MITRDANGNAVVHVQAGSAYDVTIGSGLLNKLADYVPVDGDTLRVAIVTDDKVEDLFVDQVMESFMTAGFEVSNCVIQPGARDEDADADSCTASARQLAARHLTCADMVVALGDGTVINLAGLAVSTNLRGCKFVPVPTLPLVVASAGADGKADAGLFAGERLAEGFCQPYAVVCDTDCMASSIL